MYNNNNNNNKVCLLTTLFTLKYSELQMCLQTKTKLKINL